MTAKERAAMQQALEALEESIALNKNWVSDSEPEILSYFSEHKAVIEQGEQAITALREASGNSLKPKCFADYQPNHAIDRACASCAVASECQTGEQAEQEPVAWMCWIDSDEEMNPANAQLTSYEPKAYAKRKPLYAASQPVKQEPVAEIIGFERTNDIRGVKRIPRIKWNVPLWEDESPLQLGNLYAAPQPVKQGPEYKGWYCAHCERGVDGSEVTFHEQHEVCGRVITNDVSPKPVMQEPVAWAISHSLGLEFGSKYPMQETKEAAEQMARQHMGAVVVTPLYAAPVRTKDLTDDEIDAVYEEWGAIPYTAAIRAVIAADRRKNK